MAFELSLGQYYPAGSPIHRMDPRTKLLVALAVMVLVFFIRTPLQLALGAAFVLAGCLLARVPPSKVLHAVKPVLFTVAVLSLFNLLFVREGTTLVSWGIITITEGGVRAAWLYSLRLMVGVVAGALLLLTTTPTQVTDAADAFTSPLTRIGLPGHELAMVFSLMLRFIPTLADEASAVIDAQTARGGHLADGNPVQRVKAVVPVVVALLASSVHHANDLSRALDARCYEGGAGRTHWHPLKFGRLDALAALVTLGYGVALVLLGTVA